MARAVGKGDRRAVVQSLPFGFFLSTAGAFRFFVRRALSCGIAMQMQRGGTEFRRHQKSRPACAQGVLVTLPQTCHLFLSSSQRCNLPSITATKALTRRSCSSNPDFASALSRFQFICVATATVLVRKAKRQWGPESAQPPLQGSKIEGALKVNSFKVGSRW